MSVEALMQTGIAMEDDRRLLLKLLKHSLSKTYQLSLVEAGMLLVQAWESSGRDFSDLVEALAHTAERQREGQMEDRDATWDICASLLREVAEEMRRMG